MLVQKFVIALLGAKLSRKYKGIACAIKQLITVIIIIIIVIIKQFMWHCNMATAVNNRACQSTVNSRSSFLSLSRLVHNLLKVTATHRHFSYK